MLTVVVVGAAAAGCGGLDPNAPFTTMGAEEEATPIPPGTPIIEHDPVPLDARSERIEMIEDLVVDRGAEPFYRLGGVDADAKGNFYVHDGGNQNIIMFDAGGSYLRTIGRPGQGPGELGLGGDIAVAGGNLVHAARNRINVWSAAGEPIASRNIAHTSRFSGIAGTEDGGVVGFAVLRTPGGRRQMVIRTDLDGRRERDYADLPPRRQLMVYQGDRGQNTGLPRPQPTFAISRSGEVYVTTGSDYEVLGLNPDASARWALRVRWPRQPLTDDRIQEALAHLMSRGDVPAGMSGVRRSSVDWPEALPALMGFSSAHSHARPRPIRVDGHGHLLVFPFVPNDWDRPDQPVDVYAADGTHLFSGMIPMIRWDAARGDHVYGVRSDPESEEYTVVRYRLREPFGVR